MKTVNVVLLGAFFFSTPSFAAKTFSFRSQATNQVMKVFCFNPSSIQCQSKKEEVILRLRHNTNPNVSSLSGARAEDTKNKITRDFTQLGQSIQQRAVGAGQTVRDTISDTADRVATTTAETYQNVKDGASDRLDKAKEGTISMADRLREGAANTMDQVREDAAAAGQQAREDFRPVTDAASSLADNINDRFKKMSADSCRTKLERHARDFKNNYDRTGEQNLVSYEDKMLYIKERLIEEERFDSCERHFEYAVLGYQLDWVSGKGLVAADTHIFDGHGRLADGDVGYWKSEERGSYEEFRSQAHSR